MPVCTVAGDQWNPAIAPDGQGGTIGVLVGPDGVFMVDTQFAPLSDKIAAAIKQITPQPIKFIVNTHVHGDHTGGSPGGSSLYVSALAALGSDVAVSSARV